MVEHSARDRMAGLTALVAVQFCFGLFPVFGKWAFDAFSPQSVAAWRIMTGAVVLGGIALLRFGADALPRKTDLARLFACAMLGVVLNQGLFLEGLARSTAVNAGLIMCTIPVFTYALAVAFRQEPFESLRGIGIAIALVGTVPLLIGKGGDLLGGHGFGNLLIVTNALCYSAYLVLSKPLLRSYSALVVIAWVYLLSLVSVPWFAAGERLLPEHAVADRAWWSLGYILVFATVVSYLLNTFALKRVRASTTAFFIFMQPVITGVAGIVLLDELLTPRIVVAAVLLFLGTWMVLHTHSRTRRIAS